MCPVIASTQSSNHMMDMLVFDADPKSIGIWKEDEDGGETYLPVLMFNFKISG